MPEGLLARDQIVLEGSKAEKGGRDFATRVHVRTLRTPHHFVGPPLPAVDISIRPDCGLRDLEYQVAEFTVDASDGE